MCHKLNDNGYARIVIIVIPLFPHSLFIIEFVTRVTRRVPLMVHELLSLLKHTSSPLVNCGVRAVQSLVLVVMFCISLFFFLSSLTIVLSVLLQSN